MAPPPAPHTRATGSRTPRRPPSYGPPVARNVPPRPLHSHDVHTRRHRPPPSPAPQSAGVLTVPAVSPHRGTGDPASSARKDWRGGAAAAPAGAYAPQRGHFRQRQRRERKEAAEERRCGVEGTFMEQSGGAPTCCDAGQRAWRGGRSAVEVPKSRSGGGRVQIGALF